MSAKKTTAQRLGRVLEAVTRVSGRLPETPAYGSWLLGRVSESQRRRWIRVQVILTVLVTIVNLVGIGVATLLVTVAIPVPSVFTDAPWWVTFAAIPAYITVAFVLGGSWITRRTVSALRWAIEDREPTPVDERNTFGAPWRLAMVDLILWGVGTALSTTLYGLANTMFIPRFLFAVGFSLDFSRCLMGGV
jgi:adenylate cyclase